VATGEGNLPANWVRARIADVGAVRLGRQRSPDKQSGRFTTRYLRAGNITPTGLDLTSVLTMDFTPAERAIFALVDGDLVITEASGSGPQVGRAAIWRNEIPGCCFQNTVIRWRPHAITPEFGLLTLRYRASSGVFEKIARGVGIQHLGATRFMDIPIGTPPMAEQVRIAAAVDAKLHELRQAEAALKSALKGIAAQDKEILSAAATGHLVEPEASLASRERRPYESGSEALGAALTTTFGERDLFDGPADGANVKPPPGPQPPGWAWTTIGQAGEVMLGKMREPRRHKGPNMRPYLRVANVFDARIDVSDVHEMHFSEQEAEIYALRRGDLLLNEGQSPELVGRPAMFNDEIPHACFQNTLLRFRAGPAVNAEFALIVFRHYLHAGEFKKVAQWSTSIAHLTKRRFSALLFPVPPRVEQDRIVADARRRLEGSAVQRASVEASLARIPDMVAELLGAAVGGSLVPQDRNDEPAAAMLERLGPIPPDVLPITPHTETEEADAVTEISPADGEDAPAQKLSDVLRAAGRAMTLPDLCHAAGFDRNAVGDIERFYLALRAEIGASVRLAGPVEENALVEAIDAA
jgi:type I restriction enzyme S subunit